MGYIRERKTKKGTSYRAEIRINRQDYPPYSESKTFSDRKLAEIWMNKRELELDKHPELLYAGTTTISKLTVGALITRYLDELGDQFGRTTNYTLKGVAKSALGEIAVSKLRAQHIQDFANHRLKVDGVNPSTLKNQLTHFKSVLNHAHVMWNVDIDLQGIEKIYAQLRKTRQIRPSSKRDRLPTRDELYNITEFLCQPHIQARSNIPVELLMWFAICSARREAEITRMRIADYDKVRGTCIIRDVKHPNGSIGNHRTAIISPESARLIELALTPAYRERMLKLEGADPALIFPVNPDSLGTKLRDACQCLGITDLRFHDLRHEACTRLAEKGLTIPQIQQYSLHESWGSLSRYVSVTPRHDIITLDEVWHLLAKQA